MAIKGLAMAIPIPGEKKADKKPKGVDVEIDDGGVGDDRGDHPGKTAACEDMISAFKRGDPRALAAALDDFMAMSDMPKDDEGAEEESESEM